MHHQDRGFLETWEMSDLHRRGWPNFLRDFVAEKGSFGMDLFWSLELPNGIRCTLGVCPGRITW